MTIYTNVSNLQKSIIDRTEQSKRSQSSTQIGAKINASISQDLGGGKYILNLGGSETLFVESETGFHENERVELQVRSNSNGKVELKLLSRNQDQAQNVAQISTSDTAEVSRKLQLIISTRDLPTLSQNDSSQIKTLQNKPSNNLNTSININTQNTQQTGIAKGVLNIHETGTITSTNDQNLQIDPIKNTVSTPETVRTPSSTTSSIPEDNTKSPANTSPAETRTTVPSDSTQSDIKTNTFSTSEAGNETIINNKVSVEAVAENNTQQTLPQSGQMPTTEEASQNQSAQSTQPATSNSTEEIQVVITRPDDSSEPSSVKIILPDGKVINAEILQESSDPAQINVETKEQSLKEILINDISTTTKEGTEESENTVAKSQTSSIKSILTAVASKLFALNNVEDLQGVDKASIAKMLIQRLTLPLIFPSDLGGETTQIELTDLAKPTTQLNINLAYQDVVKMLPDLLNSPTPITLTPAPEGGYQLNYQSPDLLPKTLPIPVESNEQIANILDALPQGAPERTPIEIGVKSLLQGLIKENIQNNPTNIPAQPTEDLTSKPQLDMAKLDQIIKRSGMTPSTATREAASALLDNSLPVTRDNIQSLLALSAGRSGAERTDFLQAGAKLLSLDAPLSPALASGMSKLHTDQDFISSSIQKISSALEEATHSTSIERGALNEEGNQRFDSKSSQLLMQNFSRASETLKGIPILIETLNATVEEATNNLAQQKNQTEQNTLAEGLKDFVSTSSRERLSAVETILQNSANVILESDPILSKLSSALDTVLSKLGNLPEEAAKTIETTTTEKAENTDLTKLKDIAKQELMGPKDTEKEFNLKDLLSDLSSLKSRASHPGISKVPEFWQKVELDPATLKNADMTKVSKAIEQIVNAPTPERAQVLTKELLSSVDRDTLRTIASTLQEVEREEIQKHPTLQHIREASNELRELGRALVAQKAENLATSRNDPGNFNTSIPFNFNGGENDGEDGQLSMFYNKSKGKRGNWQQRVILDLNMSVLGNIIGDIQFHEGIINVNFVSSSKDTVSILDSEKEALLSGLQDIGFTASVGVRLLVPEMEEKNSKSKTKPNGTRLLDIQA